MDSERVRVRENADGGVTYSFDEDAPPVREEETVAAVEGRARRARAEPEAEAAPEADAAPEPTFEKQLTWVGERTTEEDEAESSDAKPISKMKKAELVALCEGSGWTRPGRWRRFAVDSDPRFEDARRDRANHAIDRSVHPSIHPSIHRFKLCLDDDAPIERRRESPFAPPLVPRPAVESRRRSFSRKRTRHTLPLIITRTRAVYLARCNTDPSIESSKASLSVVAASALARARYPFVEISSRSSVITRRASGRRARDGVPIARDRAHGPRALSRASFSRSSSSSVPDDANDDDDRICARG